MHPITKLHGDTFYRVEVTITKERRNRKGIIKVIGDEAHALQIIDDTIVQGIRDELRSGPFKYTMQRLTDMLCPYFDELVKR